MSSKSPKEIERSAEVLTYLTGLTMDKKDMISKKYKYRFEQFSSGEIHTKHIRCMDCFGMSLPSIFLHFALANETKYSLQSWRVPLRRSVAIVCPPRPKRKKLVVNALVTMTSGPSTRLSQ
jgi:hypothetical protein